MTTSNTRRPIRLPTSNSLGLPPNTCTSMAYRKMLMQVAKALTPENIKSAAFIYALGGDHFETGLELFNKLEEKGVFSLDRLEPLEELLRDIDRCDLANNVIKDFRMKQQGMD